MRVGGTATRRVYSFVAVLPLAMTAGRRAADDRIGRHRPAADPAGFTAFVSFPLLEGQNYAIDATLWLRQGTQLRMSSDQSYNNQLMAVSSGTRSRLHGEH